jgi:hypothetical protein
LPLGPPGLSGSRLNFGMRFASVVPTHVTVRHGVATASKPHPHCISPHADCEWERGPLWYGCMHGGCSRTACPIGKRAGGERRTEGRQRVDSWSLVPRAVQQSKKKKQPCVEAWWGVPSSALVFGNRVGFLSHSGAGNHGQESAGASRPCLARLASAGLDGWGVGGWELADCPTPT